MSRPDDSRAKQWIDYIVNVTIQNDDQAVRDAGMGALLRLCPSQAPLVLESLTEALGSRKELEESAEESVRWAKTLLYFMQDGENPRGR
jgi:hypothetical protein